MQPTLSRTSLLHGECIVLGDQTDTFSRTWDMITRGTTSFSMHAISSTQYWFSYHTRESAHTYTTQFWLCFCPFQKCFHNIIHHSIFIFFLFISKMFSTREFTREDDEDGVHVEDYIYKIVKGLSIMLLRWDSIFQ